MIEWGNGATIICDGESKTLFPSYIDLKKAGDIFQLSFVSDINHLIIVNLNKKECETLSEKLKEVVRDD